MNQWMLTRDWGRQLPAMKLSRPTLGTALLPTLALVTIVGVAAAGVFWNPVGGYELTVLALPVAGLVYAGSPASTRSLRVRDLAAATYGLIALVVLTYGAVASRDLRGSVSASEAALIAGTLLDAVPLLLLATFGAGRSSAPARSLMLSWVLLTTLSRILHYGMAYEIGVVPHRGGGAVDFRRAFVTHVAALGFGSVALTTTLLAAHSERFTRTARLFGPLVSRIRGSSGQVGLGAIAATAGFDGPHRRVAWAAALAGLAASMVALFTEGYPTRWLFAWPPALATLTWALPSLGWERGRRLLLGVASVGLVLGLTVDTGFGAILLCTSFLASSYVVAVTRPGNASGAGAWRSWRVPAGLVASLLLSPFLLSVVITSSGAMDNNATNPDRAFGRVLALFYPGAATETWARHMYTGQRAMRDAIEHGGLFGNAWWHDSFYYPQANSDFVLSVVFRTHGIAGWGIVGLFAVLLLSLAQVALGKAFDGDCQRAEALGGLVLVSWMVMVVPALWVLGGLGLQLPWTGVPFPFLSRGLYFHIVLAVLLSAVLVADRKVFLGRSRGGAWGCPRRFLVAAFSSLGLLGAWYALALFTTAQLPVLRAPSERLHTIVIPENAGEVHRFDSASGPGEAAEYRVGSTVVRTVVHERTDRHLEDFVYISGYVFSRDQAIDGISIGQAGRISPVLNLPVLGRQVLLSNDVVLFWERGLEGRLVLRPVRGGAEVRGLPASGVAIETLDGEVPLRVGSVIPSGSVVVLGATRLGISRSSDPATALSIELEPGRPERAYVLRARQGPAFRIARDRTTVLAGLKAAHNDIGPGRPEEGWLEHRAAYRRGSIQDRGGRPLVESGANSAEYPDATLAALIGTSDGGPFGRPFGLDYVFDPLLSGEHKRGTLLQATARSLSRTPVLGENVVLTIDLDRQNKLTRLMDAFAERTSGESGSVLVLNRSNELLAIGEFDRRPGMALPCAPSAFGCRVQYNRGFWESFARRDFRRFDHDQSRNPYLRRPLLGALATELVGSAFKPIIFCAALADEFSAHADRFVFTDNIEDARLRAIPGDTSNTGFIQGVEVLTADDALLPFAGLGFPPIRNYGGNRVVPVLGAVMEKSGNIPPPYLAWDLHVNGRLSQLLGTYGLQQELLLRPEALGDYASWTNPATYVLAEPIRLAHGFDWNRPSDVLRLGIGDKVYLSLLHLAVFYSTVLVNDGEFVHPTVVSRIGRTEIGAPRFPVLESAARAQTIAAMQRLLRLPLGPEGTGAGFMKELPSAVRVIGGKTGTASTVPSDPRPHRVFVAVIEIDGEPYTVAVRVNRSTSPQNEAVELARRVVLEVLR